MRKVLITGFEPFGSESVNPSQDVLEQLNGQLVSNSEIVTCLLPVVHTESITQAIDAINTHNPDIVIALGQAAGRVGITPEKVAINFEDFVIPDNNGLQVRGTPVVEQAPTAYFSTLPINNIVANLLKHKLPAQISYSAGTFVCNHLFYGLMHFLQGKNTPCGFIHIPLSHEQNPSGDRASMSLVDMVEGVKIVVASCLDTPQDTASVSGSVC